MDYLVRRAAALLALICLAVCAAFPARAEYGRLPDRLRVTQRTVRNNQTNRKLKISRCYPETANAAVNAEIAAMIDRLAAEAEAGLPPRARKLACADTGATVRVTGTDTVSFFVLAFVSAEYEETRTAFETAVYTLSTGARLSLDDLFDAGADNILSAAVTEQLNAYFPDVQADPAALSALAARVRETPFTLSPAYLQFHYKASDLYAGKTTLMHVRIPYADLEPYMTAYARRETDNSGYLLAALTFDDGPARGITGSMIETLREHGAVGTFFNIGPTMRTTHDYVAWEHDAGHAVQSHTYSHTMHLDDRAQMFKERDRFAREQIAVIGIPPAYMRAPGGMDKLYAEYGIGLPIIRWNVLTGDAVEERKARPAEFADRMIYTLKDSAIILMHNIHWPSVTGADLIMKRLEDRGYLFVTVDEIFAIRGIPLEDNTVYFGDEADQQELACSITRTVSRCWRDWKPYACARACTSRPRAAGAFTTCYGKLWTTPWTKPWAASRRRWRSPSTRTALLPSGTTGAACRWISTRRPAYPASSLSLPGCTPAANSAATITSIRADCTGSARRWSTPCRAG